MTTAHSHYRSSLYSSSNRWSEDEDDLVCEYDSTWEETDCDSKEENSQRNSRHRWRRNRHAAKDMQTYRHGYPGKYQTNNSWTHLELDQEERMVNLQFYRNEIPSSPDNVKITEFHTCWKGDYDRLEWVHSYIQWLFPLQEAGLNYSAQVLTKREIKEFCEDQEAKQRLITSYELMLDFYGIKLVSKSTGHVERSKNWMERFDNLNRNTHNNLRITRILKSLGELGFEHYQAPLVEFFLDETLIHNNLANVKQSVMDYFLFAVLDKKKRRELIEYAFRHYKPKDEFVWCPLKIQRLLEAQKNLNDPDPKKGSLFGDAGCDQKNETNLTKDKSDTSKAFQCLASSLDPQLDLDDPGKDSQLGEPGCHQENKTIITKDSPDTSKAFQCPTSSVDPLLERSSVEPPTTVIWETDQASFPGSVSLSGDSPLEEHIQGPGVEYICSTNISQSLQESVTDYHAQEEETEAKTERNKAAAETQSNSQDIKNNLTANDTPAAAEQELTLEKQDQKEMAGMAKNPSDNFAEEMHNPARQKYGLSDSCSPIQDGGVSGTIDAQLSKRSESPTAAEGVKKNLISMAEDTESKGFLSKGEESSQEPSSAAENDKRPKGMNESHQPQTKGEERHKLEVSAVESSGVKGRVEDSVSLAGAIDLHRPEDAATVGYILEGRLNERMRPDIEADKGQRPDTAVKDTASVNDAGNVLFNPDEVKTSNDAMKVEDSDWTPREDRGDCEEKMEIEEYSASTELDMEY